MALLNISNVSKAYGDKVVLEGISLQIEKGDKIGLVGFNGVGKTTLLKIMIGSEEPDAGQVNRIKDLKLGYLSQKPEIESGETLNNYLAEAVKDILTMQAELKSLEQELSNPAARKDEDGYESLLSRYGRLAHEFEQKGGYLLDKKLKSVIAGMGFKNEDMERSLTEFSGGEKTRIQLARLLLQDPDILLLDEPTNHLDVDTVEWLEGYLRECPFAVLAVSHDRYFLDRVVTGIVSLEANKLTPYRGNYSDFAAQKEQAEAAAAKSYQLFQKTVARDLDIIRRAGGDQRSKRQARSRAKRLEKMTDMPKPVKEKNMSLKFGFAGRSGNVVVVLKNVGKEYDGEKIFSGANLEIRWGDKVALIGPNGAGKTTLLRLLTGEERQSEGEIRIGSNVRIAYFNQEQEQLDLNSTPLETIMLDTDLSALEARSYLGRYLFSGDAVFKEIRSLSGGERSRLALARVALTTSNFLILDEPTNHLDIRGVEELEKTLALYPGTILVVSHDRYFVSRTATRIIEIRKGKVRFFKGDYWEYEAQKAAAEAREKELPDKPAARKEQRESEKEARQKLLDLRRDKRNIENKIKEVEAHIAVLEEKIALLQEQLADPALYDDYAAARRLAEEFKLVKEKTGKLYGEWEKLSLRLEAYPDEEEIN